MVYWNSNEIIGAVIGGSLIALSSTLNLYFFGRITGISGSVQTLIKYDKGSGFNYKYSFILGLILIPTFFHSIFGNEISLGDGKKYTFFDS